MDMLQAAAEAKSQQLKARPGRAAWEAAPVFFRNVAAVDAEISELRAGDFRARVEAAVALKQQGNALVDEDALSAVQLFMRAFSIFVWFDRGKGRAAEDIPLVDTISSMDESGEKDEACALAAALMCNAAACLLKEARYSDAVYATSKALVYDPFSIKALFRRAQAHYKSQNLEEAVKDLQAALALEPGNAQVRTSLTCCQAELQAQRKRDRAMASNMFKHGSLYDDDEDEGPGQQGRGKVPDAEVQRLMREMRRSMHTAGTTKPPVTNRFGFPKLPWWAWAVILLHMLWRLYKIFKPFQGRARGATDSPADDGEL